MKELVIDCLLDSLIDTAKIVPFLFLTYIVMEYVEHNMEEKTKDIIRKAGRKGPFLGGILGIIPQCGFSAAASNLYVGRVITIGTLIAVYLSTSDEMLPIMISSAAPVKLIVFVIVLKAFLGILLGYIVELIFGHAQKMRAYAERPNEDELFHIDQICENDNCKCNHGILVSALKHTLQISIFLFLVSLALNVGIEWIGEDKLSSFILNKPVIGVFLSGIIGLIPNCAASVVITSIYLEGLMSFGAMMSGLLVGAGVGILVLIRGNGDIRDTMKVIGVLYTCGVSAGLLIEMVMLLLGW